jgi:threonine dehydratase
MMTMQAKDAVRAAAERIRTGILRTPTVRSRTFSNAVGGDVYLKIENRQTTGSYKERGALNAMLQLGPAERERGVITMSAGNHGQAVAYHGARLGLKTTVVMPETTPFLKVRRTRGFGAEVVLHGLTFDEAADFARASAARTGATVVHPYDDPNVIAGQATATLELLEDAGTDIDVLLVPVGGGGLIAGATLAVAAGNSKAEIIGVQSAFYPSIAAARTGTLGAGGPTIAEGIAVKRLGRLPLALIASVNEVILVSEAAIETAIAYLLEDEKLVAEGAGATGVAALLADPARFAGKRVGTLICGGTSISACSPPSSCAIACAPDASRGFACTWWIGRANSRAWRSRSAKRARTCSTSRTTACSAVFRPNTPSSTLRSKSNARKTCRASWRRSPNAASKPRSLRNNAAARRRTHAGKCSMETATPGGVAGDYHRRRMDSRGVMKWPPGLRAVEKYNAPRSLV